MTDPPTTDRILYVITDEISSVFLRGQLAHIRTAGFEVHVAVRTTPESAAARFDDGVVVHPVPFVREPSPLADLRAFIGLVRLVRRLRPRLVNASTPKAGLLGTIAAFVCRVPVRVYVVRGLRWETVTGAGGALLRLLDRVAVRCATQVLGNSASLLTTMRERGVLPANRGLVLGRGSGNGVDVPRFARVAPHDERTAARQRLGIDEHHIVIGFVGRFTNDKGIADLVGVLDHEFADRPEVRLLLVGGPETGDPVAADVLARIADDDRIVAPGWVTDTATVYPAMDVLAFPSAREGLPNVVLEAQASGLPVVAYAATGTVDAMDDGVTGVLVPVGDARALGAALARLVDDAAERERLGAQAARFVTEHFDRTVVWQRLVDAYRTWLGA
jgi:glycosyltransferase involved in cell wall biosynthesis